MTLINSIKTTILITGLFLMPAVASAELKYDLTNFLGVNLNSIEELLAALLNIFIIVATPIIVMFIIYSGFLYVTANGNAAQVEKATKSLTYSIIGGLLIIGAVAIGAVLQGTITAFSAP